MLPGLADLRMLFASERVREVLARVPAVPAVPAAAPVAPVAAGEDVPIAPGVVRRPPATPEARAVDHARHETPSEAVEVSGRARWMSALDTAGDTAARAATIARGTVPEGPVVASPGTTARGPEVASPAALPGATPAAATVPHWLPASLATLRLEPAEPDEADEREPSSRRRDPGGRSPHARLTAVLDHLGRIDIDVSLEPAGARIVLVADERWRPALEVHVADLAQALEARGVALASYEVRRG